MAGGTPTDLPRVSFGLIVLNGEPFTRYCLRSLYPFAHELIVVEGAVENASVISTPEGHSTDETLETLRRFKAEEDPDEKLQIVTREGFWSEKDEQCRAFAERAAGDYLWQVDIDEFYRPDDMREVLALLAGDSSISAASFHQVNLWGGFDYVVDGWYLRRGGSIFHRLFRWQPGYVYSAHRPPTVRDESGRDLRDLNWLPADSLAARGIYLYHYSLVFPKQVVEKCAYYDAASWADRTASLEWAKRNFLGLKHPYRVHNVYAHVSWLERFEDEHPPAIADLRRDLAAGRLDVEPRPNADVEHLLDSRPYRLGRYGLKRAEPFDRGCRRGKRLARAIASHRRRDEA